MKRKLLCAFIALATLPVWAEGGNNEKGNEFSSDEKLKAGFVTDLINRKLEQSMENTGVNNEIKYGRTITDYVTAPKFGGYVIGKFDYTNKDGAHNGAGFSQRLIRFYVDGKILRDFTYRIQIQTNNASFHMKDWFVEWTRFPEFKVKIGQFKRAFGLENPMNPWDLGSGDYTQLTKKLTGHSDYIGAETSSNGGRDQGIQIQGDLFPIGSDKHKLLHYQVMLSNGQGINMADANSHKDISGTIQFQPIKGLFVGAYGWTGNATYSGITADKKRYLLTARYDANGWSARAEYAHSTGHKIADYQLEDGLQVLKSNASNGRADSWYATVGIPCTPWLKTWLKYDVYRDDATWDTNKSIYSVCPNFQLHKNLMFQVEYHYVHDRTVAKNNYHELWVETYVRF